MGDEPSDLPIGEKERKADIGNTGKEPLLPGSHGVMGNPLFEGPPTFDEGYPQDFDPLDDCGGHAIASRDRPPPK